MKKSCFLLLCLFAILFITCKRLPDVQIPPPGEVVESYKDVTFTNYFKSTTGWNAGDVGISINLNNGKSLWVYGDSFTDQLNATTGKLPCLFNVRNAAVTMGIANPQQQQTYKGTGNIKSYFQLPQDQENKYWFWPGVGYTNGDTAYVFMGRIKSTGGSGAFGFEAVDSQYIAKIHVPTMQVTGYISKGPLNNMIFINGVVKDGEYNYVYGTRNNGFGWDVMVARYPYNNIYAAWQYYNGTAWTTNITEATKVHSEFTSSFDVFKHKGKYVLISTEISTQCDQGKEIYSYTSDNPYGPFSNKKTIWKLDDLKDGHYPFFYIAAAHPEYDNDKNELLLTYSINGYQPCIPMCKDGAIDPNDYRPKAVRVPYKLIDASF